MYVNFSRFRQLQESIINNWIYHLTYTKNLRKL